ncbi:hypothetical protein BG006_008815 [Podila minutissima]|uniref:FAD-binding domain-containing protein n=1 Tax=Podila minutissima TaxID=64525 RepID=A0A9P5SR43_9FUNG|nr:hypothetical protein BG006_008815 [Podila minutissima]
MPDTASTLPSPESPIDASTSVQEIPVLIVGAGPVGLLEAILLTKMGIRVRIIDREPHISPFSRALGVLPRTLEILAMIEDGFIDKFLAQGKSLQEANFYYGSRPRCTIPLGSIGISRYERPLLMEQERLSKVLAKELEEMGVPIEFGWELVDTEVVEFVAGTEESYVKTMIRQAVKPEDGEQEHQIIQSEYLVAADGGHSTVRRKVNIKFPGRTLPHKNVMLDGIIDTDLELKDAVTITGVNQKTLLIFGLSDNIYRIIVEMEDFTPEEDLRQINRELTVKGFEHHARGCLHPGTKFNVVKSTWLTCIRFNERRADRYIHKDRIFLAGDSAHVHSPAGGQGMNTGLQDAHNLAWKLALVLNKLSPPRLLKSYQEERMPMADRAIALSSKLLAGDRDQGTVWHIFRMLFLMLSPLLMYINSTSFPRLISMLDIRYPANNINLPHKTQTQPKEEVHQIGARAPDGLLLHFLPSASEDLPSDNDGQAVAACKAQRVYVQELTVGVGRFHILVFVGSCLSSLALFKARELELDQRIEEYLLQWRAQWNYTLSRDDKTDGQLVKVHVIATGDASESHGKGLLAQRAQGDGRLFWDSSAEVHASYGVPVLAKDQGAIVVIRPDSHIGFRVRGLDKGAWEDVTEYLQTILV